MKRAGNLIESVCDADNLRLAYFKACRGKRGKPEVLRFRERLDTELELLADGLRKSDLTWGPYKMFQVHDPKPRSIFAAPFRDRVAHHAIINICEPVFERYQVYDSYACRKGKGLDAALRRSLEFVRNGDWYLQMDVRKYFDSIDHSVLKALMYRRFKDPILLNLMGGIIDSYSVSQGKGVPIGNLTSQYFANHYLALLDHHIKEQMRSMRYVRYMDDFVIWSSDKDNLKSSLREISGFLEQHLRVDLKVARLNRCDRGMSFLGYRLFPGKICLTRRTRDRFKRKARVYTERYRDGVWSEADLARHMEPLLSFVRRGLSKGIRVRTFASNGLCPGARTG